MKKILVVDDEVDILETIIDTLEIEFADQVAIDRALNGVEAIDLFEKHQYDLIITDLNMPEMDGLDLSIKVKQINQKIPIIVFTGHGDVEEFGQLKDLGVLAMIKKPYVEDLLKTVSQAIG